MLGEQQLITLTISEQVISETRISLARKVPGALPLYEELVQRAGVRTVADPAIDIIQQHEDVIADPDDVPIVVAAMLARVDYLVTLNRRHFIDDPKVAARSGLPIGTPGDALAWVRRQLGI
jgi:hypothetical protein